MSLVRQTRTSLPPRRPAADWTTASDAGSFIPKRIEPCGCGGVVVVADVLVLRSDDAWKAVERAVMAHQRTPQHAEWSARVFAEQAS